MGNGSKSNVNVIEKYIGKAHELFSLTSVCLKSIPFERSDNDSTCDSDNHVL